MNPYLELTIEIGIVATILIMTLLLFATDIWAEIEQDSLDQLKKDAEASDLNFKKTSREIVDTKIRIRDLQQELVVQLKIKDDLIIKAKTDWDSIPKVALMESAINSTETSLDQNKVKLGELQFAKAELKTSSLSLSTQYDTDLEQFKDENTFDPSKYTKIIGVRISEGCQELVKNNFTTDCPSYEELYQLDSSNEDFSGKFEYLDGFWSRGKSLYEDGYKFYAYDKSLRLFVDPSVEDMARIPMITIENNFEVYFVPSVDNKLHNNTRTYHEIRYVDPNCRNAQLSVINWTSTLPDTIHYLRTNCTVTGLDISQEVVREETFWEPLDSPGWHYREWIDAMKKLCLGLC